MSDEIPRSHRMDQWTPAERAIYDAVQVVEAAGCDKRLTWAVTLLSEAQANVADFVDHPELTIGSAEDPPTNQHTAFAMATNARASSNLARAYLELRQAITTHRAQKADDRCIEDDDRLYAALGDGIKCDRRVGSKEAMLQNCARFIDQRCEGGGWPSYVELEVRVEELEKELERMHVAAGQRAEKLAGLQKKANDAEELIAWFFSKAEASSPWVFSVSEGRPTRQERFWTTMHLLCASANDFENFVAGHKSECDILRAELRAAAERENRFRHRNAELINEASLLRTALVSDGLDARRIQELVEELKLAVDKTHSELAQERARSAELERRLTIPEANLRCAKCGGAYLFDTSIPSAVWNRVVRVLGGPEYLCLQCIVKIFVAAGESFTAQLWGRDLFGPSIEFRIGAPGGPGRRAPGGGKRAAA